VKVHVVGNPGAGRASDVRSNVESLGVQRASQHIDGAAERAHEEGGLLIVQLLEPGHVGHRDDHRVAGVVGKLVQHHERAFGPPDHELRVRIVGVLDDAAEQAARLLLAADVLHAPRRPQSLH